MTRRVETLQREAIAHRAALRVAALDVRDRLTPDGLRAEARLQAERVGFTLAASARSRWIEVGAIAVALLAVGLAMAQGRRRSSPVSRPQKVRWRTSPVNSNPRKEISNGDDNQGDDHEDPAADRIGLQAGRTQPQARGPGEIG